MTHRRGGTRPRPRLGLVSVLNTPCSATGVDAIVMKPTLPLLMDRHEQVTRLSTITTTLLNYLLTTYMSAAPGHEGLVMGGRSNTSETQAQGRLCRAGRCRGREREAKSMIRPARTLCPRV